MFERVPGENRKAGPESTGLVEGPANSTFQSRTVMQWAEHCSECAMPACFTSCAFYNPRTDLKCQRFPGGIESAATPSHPAVFRVRFGKWAKLQAFGKNTLVTNRRAGLLEKIDHALAAMLGLVPMPVNMRSWVSRKFYGLKNKVAAGSNGQVLSPHDRFVLHVANERDRPVDVRISFVNPGKQESHEGAVFQYLLRLEPGANQFGLACSDIFQQVDLTQDYLVQLEAAEPDAPMTLVIGFADFVRPVQHIGPAAQTTLASKSTNHDKKIKCLVWDLDNTLWHGTLIEDGEENLFINDAAIKLIKELDRRGILNAIASKNYKEAAMAVLQRLEIADYFLVPQINWQPKSQAITAIASELNIGIDSLAFVDDQPFERAEVAGSHPEVTIFDQKMIPFIANLPAFDVPVSEESGRRREMYRDQIARNVAFSNASVDSGGNYDEFLRSCDIKMELQPLTQDTVERAHELAQRTNQMNFSGNRYSTSELQEIMNDDNKCVISIRVSDKFGSYGIVGLCILELKSNRVIDLMFSCRIQAKKVDETFLAWLFRKYGSGLRIRYVATERNARSASVFESLGLEEDESSSGNAIVWCYPEGKVLPNNDLIEIDARAVR